MQRVGWWVVVAVLFLGGEAWWRWTAPADTGAVHALDGGGGQPPPTHKP